MITIKANQYYTKDDTNQINPFFIIQVKKSLSRIECKYSALLNLLIMFPLFFLTLYK